MLSIFKSLYLSRTDEILFEKKSEKRGVKEMSFKPLFKIECFMSTSQGILEQRLRIHQSVNPRADQVQENDHSETYQSGKMLMVQVD